MVPRQRKNRSGSASSNGERKAPLPSPHRRGKATAKERANVRRASTRSGDCSSQSRGAFRPSSKVRMCDKNIETDPPYHRPLQQVWSAPRRLDQSLVGPVGATRLFFPFFIFQISIFQISIFCFPFSMFPFSIYPFAKLPFSICPAPPFSFFYVPISHFPFFHLPFSFFHFLSFKALARIPPCLFNDLSFVVVAWSLEGGDRCIENRLKNQLEITPKSMTTSI